MELRLSEIKLDPVNAATPRRRSPVPAAAPVTRFIFVTYAFEIEGDAPLILCAEAVDD
jgi:hypothetical protein